jgi:sortase A
MEGTWRRRLQSAERVLFLIAALAFTRLAVDFISAEYAWTVGKATLRGTASENAAVARPAGVPRVPLTGSVSDEAITTFQNPESAQTTGMTQPAPFVGELRIPRVDLSTPVFDTPDPAQLRHAAGHLRPTALPWEPGNSAIAGHRDSEFRKLKWVRPGDDIRLTTPRGTFDYLVTRAFVVYPGETWVLGEDAAALTLITCFPFRWVGTAPERWIVQAKRSPRDPREERP